MAGDIKLGETPTSPGTRDAVHVAVMVVVAQESLQPGAPVGFDGTSKKPVGIVDPWLRWPVKKGDLFYLCLKPGTITSLRHEWEHPALNELSEEEIVEYRGWFMTLAEEMNISFDHLMDCGAAMCDGRSSYSFSGSSSAPEVFGYGEPSKQCLEFLTKYCKFMKRKIPDVSNLSFSCSC